MHHSIRRLSLLLALPATAACASAGGPPSVTTESGEPVRRSEAADSLQPTDSSRLSTIWQIGTEEIAASDAENVLELVRQVRPGWLEGYRDSENVRAFTEPFIAFVDGRRLGGLMSLGSVPTDSFAVVRLLPRSVAQDEGFDIRNERAGAIVVEHPAVERAFDPELAVYPVGYPITGIGVGGLFDDAGLVEVSSDPSPLLPVLFGARAMIRPRVGVELLLGEGGSGRVEGTDPRCTACSTGRHGWDYSTRFGALLVHYAWGSVRFGVGASFLTADYVWDFQICSIDDRCLWDTQEAWNFSTTGLVADLGYRVNLISRLHADVKLQARRFGDVPSAEFFQHDTFTQQGLYLLVGLGVRP